MSTKLKTTLKALTAATLFATTLSTLSLFAMTETVHAATYMPAETELHEGTWLQWPHHYTYGTTYRSRLDATWVAMTKALSYGERVHIIAYNSTEQQRISQLLQTAGVLLSQVDFLIQPTDDVWVRDNGPVFVLDDSRKLKITDWGFNGWGMDTPYKKDNVIPATVAQQRGIPRIDLNGVVLEGGAIELDGNGTLLATRSSILEPKRNPNLTQAQLEQTLRTQLGVKKFIWLNGKSGGKEDITDMHIDGFARFADENTLVTLSTTDLRYWELSSADINVLNTASDVNGKRYGIVRLPLTARDVKTAYGKSLGYKGSYVNYYVGNGVVLVPTYNDPNDQKAINALQALYPNRSVVGIDVRNLYENGGMVHCVTQQQPAAGY